MNDFPADDVLVARGKYSTLASERRNILKALRNDMEALAEYARRVLRSVDDLSFAEEELLNVGRRIGAAQGRLHDLRTLAPQLAELKPLAWGEKEPE